MEETCKVYMKGVGVVHWIEKERKKKTRSLEYLVLLLCAMRNRDVEALVMLLG